jgi:hypothetical protein
MVDPRLLALSEAESRSDGNCSDPLSCLRPNCLSRKSRDGDIMLMKSFRDSISSLSACTWKITSFVRRIYLEDTHVEKHQDKKLWMWTPFGVQY